MLCVALVDANDAKVNELGAFLEHDMFETTGINPQLGRLTPSDVQRLSHHKVDKKGAQRQVCSQGIRKNT